jgi:hypothetical protein
MWTLIDLRSLLSAACHHLTELHNIVFSKHVVPGDKNNVLVSLSSINTHANRPSLLQSQLLTVLLSFTNFRLLGISSFPDSISAPELGVATVLDRALRAFGPISAKDARSRFRVAGSVGG